MRLTYTGQETIPLPLDQVWAFINDPHKVASCLPDVQSVEVHDPTHLDVTVRVGVGPVRGNFKFKIELQPDPADHRMGVKISGGGLGSVVDLLASARLKEEGGNTVLDWSGEAVMRGPIAAVGGRVLDAQAQKLIGQTFANVKTAVERASRTA
ncbi:MULTISPECIES: carbon monoxide dehydrogenase subunit G [unclassified Meiothermus]|uniref:SRPBCC family protein n=1 Tax=unclassified Meiothermus TaxID=370471 RepID=UPI000D7BD7BE|nr:MULTISPECIES: carbon monoxide dehydrogenase subunit G [unclassified Meiothermus]PZA07933.1 carbon monoxide dehydrogenase [Meiothermus sp. Pnk-1]RYM36720.1 carbon monoxide dehydrogenase [Meiothermus sp. PNK-Is4]